MKLNHCTSLTQPTFLSLKVQHCPTACAEMADHEDQGVDETKGQKNEEQNVQYQNDWDEGAVMTSTIPLCDSALHTHWRYLHRRPVNMAISPIVEVQRLAWSDWFEQFNATK